MKKLYPLIIAILALTISQKATAQDDISGLFKGGPSDVNKLMNAYATPLFKGFGNSLNGGWTNTAKTHKFLRFDIRISASASLVPAADRSFDINSLGLENIKPTNSSQSIAPTFAGDTKQSTGITFTDPSNPAAKYNTTLPSGVTKYIPAPQIQLALGLVKNTDLMVRFIPTTKITDDVGSVGMFGLGLKHNFAGDFGKAGKIMPFDLALAIGFTHLNYKKPLDVTPDADNAGTSGSQDYSNQSLTGNFSGWNAEIIISKKLAFFTPFASVGCLASKTDIGLKGNYPFVTGADLVTQKPKYTTYADPINISGNGTGVSGLHADVGFQLSLAFFKVYASYSLAEYQSGNVGIGFGF